RAIDPARIQARPLKATYAILREALEGSVATRVCRNELWPVSQMTGWQVGLGYLVTIQPTGSADARAQTLARWRAIPKYLEVETANLRQGMKLGYTSPKHIVSIVISSVRTLAAAPAADNPFLAPARADKDEAFVGELTQVVNNDILPAARRYA